MAKARPIPELGEDDAFAAAAAKIVAMRTRELADEATGVLDVEDIERVHDMRVATRRLRAALEVFEPCFPKRRFRSTLKEVKALADALGERRDRDVTIAALIEFQAEIGAADRPGIRNLVERLRHEQAKANEGLAPYVTRARVTALRERLDELVAEAANLVADADADVDVETTPPSAPARVAAPASPPAAPAVTNGGEPR
jgi:CHAD domain-containing protein